MLCDRCASHDPGSLLIYTFRGVTRRLKSLSFATDGSWVIANDRG